MEVSEKAWRGFTRARTMLLKCSIGKMSEVLSMLAIPAETQEAMKKELKAGAYANYLAWEALDTMEGFHEMMVAIQTMKNEGIITVKQDETAWTGLI